MSLPRQFPIRVAVIIAVLVMAVLILIRYQEGRDSADPWHQLQQGYELDLPLAELRPRLRAALADMSPQQPAQHVDLMLDVWTSMEGINERPPPAVLADPLWEWVGHAIDERTFDLGVVNRIVTSNQFSISADNRQEIMLRLQRRLALLHAQIGQFGDVIDDQVSFEFLGADGFRAQWKRLTDRSSFPGHIGDDVVFQERLDAWITRLEEHPGLNALQTQVKESPVDEISAVLAAAQPADRAVFSWWLEWSMNRAEAQESPVAKNPAYRRAHLICWPEDKGSSWWLVLVALVALCLGAQLIRWRSLGPSPVDPAAETLERVDPIDLDTQAVTISNPGLDTDDFFA